MYDAAERAERCSALRTGLKSRHSIAQGEALGKASKKFQALKGRNNFRVPWVSPFQG